MKWPNSLVTCIARNKSVLFLGAGLSMNSMDREGNHPKDWRGFLESGLNKLTDASSKGLSIELIQIYIFDIFRIDIVTHLSDYFILFAGIFYTTTLAVYL